MIANLPLRSGKPATVGLGAMVITGAIGLGVAAGLAPRVALGIVGGLVALGFALAVWKRPAVGLFALILFLPIYQLVFAKLYISGAPAQMLQPLRFWKEIVVAVLVLKVVHDGWGPLGWADWAGLGLLALIGLYAVAPIGPPPGTKLLAAREEGMFVLVFLAARHLRLPPWISDRLEFLILAYGVVIGGFAFMNHFFPTSWDNFIQNSGLNQYRAEVTGIKYTTQSNLVYDSFAGHSFIRAGSLAFYPIVLAFGSLVPIGIAMARTASHGRRAVEILFGLCWLAALILSLTRSAIYAVPVMVLVVAMVRGIRQRLVFALIFGTIVLFPLASAVGLTGRLVSVFDLSSGSGLIHVGTLQADLGRVLAYPFGNGLGTSALVGQRTETAVYVDTESWYFQVGTDLGLLGMALYITLQSAVIAALWRRARSGNSHAAGALAGLVGLALGGIFLSSFGDLGTAWTIYMFCGLALSSRLAAAPESTTSNLRTLEHSAA